MGVIWLQTSNGRLIHLPIVGGDFNSPDSPVKIPTSVIGTRNRCYTGQITVIYQSQSITFNFNIPGRSGTCNQCGQCCTHTVATCPGSCDYILDTRSGLHVCSHLTILPKGIGKSGGTECSIFSDLVNLCKGCITFPEKQSDVAHCTACSFTWSS